MPSISACPLIVLGAAPVDGVACGPDVPIKPGLSLEGVCGSSASLQQVLTAPVEEQYALRVSLPTLRVRHWMLRSGRSSRLRLLPACWPHLQPVPSASGPRRVRAERRLDLSHHATARTAIAACAAIAAATAVATASATATARILVRGQL